MKKIFWVLRTAEDWWRGRWCHVDGWRHKFVGGFEMAKVEMCGTHCVGALVRWIDLMHGWLENTRATNCSLLCITTVITLHNGSTFLIQHFFKGTVFIKCFWGVWSYKTYSWAKPIRAQGSFWDLLISCITTLHTWELLVNCICICIFIATRLFRIF